MTLEELKAQNPEVYNAIVAIGRKEGEAAERDRVCAHLTMGEKSGDMATAIAAINAGDGMTMTLQAKYMTAGMNRSAQQTRQAETETAAATVAGAAAAPGTPPPAPSTARDQGDAIADALAKQLGKEKA